MVHRSLREPGAFAFTKEGHHRHRGIQKHRLVIGLTVQTEFSLVVVSIDILTVPAVNKFHSRIGIVNQVSNSIVTDTNTVLVAGSF